jgi:hypothetical protein
LDSLLVTKASNAPTDTSMQQVASALEALTQVVKMQSTAGSPTSNVAKDEHLSEEKTSDPWSEFDRKSSL